MNMSTGLTEEACTRTSTSVVADVGLDHVVAQGGPGVEALEDERSHRVLGHPTAGMLPDEPHGKGPA